MTGDDGLDTPGRDTPTRAGRRFAPDILGVTWVVASAVAVLLPALSQGAGIYSISNQFDLVDSAIPWATLAWRQVHSGNLPLWNPYSALGTPFAFDWHSVPFGVPSLVGYLFPLRLDFAVRLIVTLIIAGTGVYVLGRVLRLGVLACVFASVAYELSGPIVQHLGVPVSLVMAWAGWLFALALLIVRSHHGVRDITAFAVVLACAIYSGQPELLVQLLLAILVFLVILLAIHARRNGLRTVVRPVRDLALAAAAGAALGAPLALPAIQLTAHSLNSIPALRDFGKQPSTLNSLLYMRINGSYLGLICLVLAVVGLALRRRQPEVVSLGVLAVAAAAAALVPPVVSLLNRLPILGDIHWSRAVLAMAFAIAVLGGIGFDILLRATDKVSVPRWATASFAVAGLVLLAIVLFVASPTGLANALRTKTFVWRAVEAGTGFAVAGTLIFNMTRGAKATHTSGRHERLRRLRILAGMALLMCETAFLVAAGAPIWSSSATKAMPWSPNPALLDVQRAVGSSLVGFGNSKCFPGSLGILQNVNLTYKVNELAVYDQLIPIAYLQAWKAETGTSAYRTYGIYCPAITTATLARRYGVSLVLEPHGAPGPQGAVYDGHAGYSDLYRIPGAARATLTRLGSTTSWPGPDAPGTPVPVTHGNPATWRLVTDAKSPSALRLRLTDVPGWHATIDGHPLALSRFSGIMLQARVPAGRHVIKLDYWPETFSLGIALAAIAVAGLVLTPVAFKARSAWGRRQAVVPKVPSPSA